eukprot:GGOE01028320.1.p1 GENE.GGOE01028320.1~~GGOE01028320.1.p1  ORF type:complete len:809 (-),score=209.56 GGOE01028320.1:402-2828(-)
MLDDGPLIAPCCFHLPPTLNPLKLFDWLFQLEVHLLMEIFTLSSKSVLYDMAVRCLQRPRHRRVTVTDGSELAALMLHFSELLRRFEHNTLLGECRMLFMNHFQAGLSCIRFQPALESLLPSEAAQLAYGSAQQVVQSPSRSGSVLSAKETLEHCVAEDVSRDKWVFRDVNEEELQRLWPQGNVNGIDNSRRLLLGAEAKLAYSVTLFVWAVVGLLSRRIEMLQEFPSDHPLFMSVGVPKVSSLGDSFETLMMKRKEAMQLGLALYKQQNWQAALEQLTRTIAMPPEGEEGKYFIYQFRAACHFYLGDYQRAVEDCTTALHCNPSGYTGLHLRAEAYEAMGQLDAAVQDTTQLVHLYPNKEQGREFHDRLIASLPLKLSNDFGKPCPKMSSPSTNGETPEGHSFTSSCPMESPYTSIASRVSLQCPGTSSSSSSSVGPLAFTSAQCSFNLAALPVHPEPLTVDDPPYLLAFVESGAELEYTICGGRELGRGAFGRVYKAVHPLGGWFMAIKEVEAKEVEGSEDVLCAFELTVTMKHNNIVRCLGMRRLPGFYHIVMEYCSGGSLRGLINDLRGLSLSLMRKYATEVLRGLRYMHGHGLLHRDIKASNVLLRDDGVAKVADFGTVLKIPEEETPACGSVKGTVLWMAPETFRGRYSTASDMWSFGCMLIEMATANDPWHEQQFREQLTAMVFIATRPDALPSIPPQLNEDLGTHFFHCCVARDPMERCSADLLLRHLWLSSIEPRSPASPVTTNATSIQGCYRDKSADKERGYPWTTCTSITESALLVTTASASLLVESLTDDTAHGGQ